jgi:hypothetical protein
VNEWLEEFYGSEELRAALAESFRPMFVAYAAQVIDGPVDEAFLSALIASYVERYLDSSRAQLQEVLTDAADPVAALEERFTEWTERRPGKVAQRELVRVREAMAMAQMPAQGVERKAWATRGSETCPSCRSMNGRTAEVSGDFFGESDEFLPEGAERPLAFNRSIAHPPLHDGCDCTLAPA